MFNFITSYLPSLYLCYLISVLRFRFWPRAVQSYKSPRMKISDNLALEYIGNMQKFAVFEPVLIIDRNSTVIYAVEQVRMAQKSKSMF